MWNGVESPGDAYRDQRPRVLALNCKEHVTGASFIRLAQASSEFSR
jgi:hypothetical protein